MSERIRSTWLGLQHLQPLGAAAGLVDHQRVKSRLAQGALHNLAHYRGIVNNQGANLTHAQAPLLRSLSALLANP